MELEYLEAEIEEKIRKIKYPQIKGIIPTFYLIFPSLAELKEYKHLFFGDSSEIKTICPWIFLNKSNSLDFKKAITTALDIKIEQELVEKGITVANKLYQLIVIADLTKDENILSVITTFKTQFQEIMRGFYTSIFIGIFLTRTESNGKIIFSSNLKEKLRTFLNEGIFNKIFLLDIANKAGRFLNNRGEQLNLIMYFLNYLFYITNHFIKKHNLNNYTEWLKGMAGEGILNSFSAGSLRLPLKEILEYASIKKGADILETAFMGESVSKEVVNLYFNDFLNKTKLNTLETWKRQFLANEDFPLLDPFKKMLSVNTSDFVSYSKFLTNFDKYFSDYREENFKILQALSEFLKTQFKYLLNTQLEKIIGNEVRSFLIAKEFLKELKHHLFKLIHKEIEFPNYKDPLPLCEKLKQLIKHQPKPLSLWARTLTFCVIISLCSIPFLFTLSNFFLFFAFLITASGTAFISWHSWKTEVQNKLIELEEVLRNKWNVLIETEVLKISIKLLKELYQIVEEDYSKLVQSYQRMQEIVTYLKKKYIPKKEKQLGLFKDIQIFNNEELMQEITFKVVPKTIEDIVVKEFIDEKNLLIWQRMSPPQGEEKDINLNTLEKQILGCAALKALPLCLKEMNISICSYISEENIKEFFKFIEPFIPLTGEAPSVCLKIFLFYPSANCEDFITHISKHFQLEKIEFSKYEFTLLNIAEGLKLEYIDL